MNGYVSNAMLGKVSCVNDFVSCIVSIEMLVMFFDVLSCVIQGYRQRFYVLFFVLP